MHYTLTIASQHETQDSKMTQEESCTTFIVQNTRTLTPLNPENRESPEEPTRRHLRLTAYAPYYVDHTQKLHQPTLRNTHPKNPRKYAP